MVLVIWVWHYQVLPRDAIKMTGRLHQIACGDVVLSHDCRIPTSSVWATRVLSSPKDTIIAMITFSTSNRFIFQIVTGCAYQTVSSVHGAPNKKMCTCRIMIWNAMKRRQTCIVNGSCSFSWSLCSSDVANIGTARLWDLDSTSFRPICQARFAQNGLQWFLLSN